MKASKIPLFNQSSAYVKRLQEAVDKYEESIYYSRNRINWSYKYCRDFFERELLHFERKPIQYLVNQTSDSPIIEDVWALKLGSKQLAWATLKILAHIAFRLIGRIQLLLSPKCDYPIYRKGYVDDIELVFDPNEQGVIRAIYPFPLNFRRQILYLKFLKRQRYKFTLDGNPYSFGDLFRFLMSRKILHLAKMEVRAQLRLAQSIRTKKFSTIQLSDEFDIGSLYLCRALSKHPVKIINSAHGVGKYLPVHAYKTFYIITERQKEYYLPTRDCAYLLRPLNDKLQRNPNRFETDPTNHYHFVFLSQLPAGGKTVVKDEQILLPLLNEELGEFRNATLWYKKHPNNNKSSPPQGFRLLDDIREINGLPGTIFASFYSTCQIDPTFKGRKILIQSELIFPGIAFDEKEEILNFQQLTSVLKNEFSGGAQQN